MRTFPRAFLAGTLILTSCSPIEDLGPPPQKVASERAQSPSITETKASSSSRSGPSPSSSEPLRVGGDVKPPKIVKRVAHQYPAIDPGREYIMGILILEAVIDKTGHVRDVKIVKGPDNQNSRAVIEALRKWEFHPGTLHGRPVDVVFGLTVNHFPMGEPPN